MDFYKGQGIEVRSLTKMLQSEIRVTDRRRRYMDQDLASEPDSPTEKPNLKPSYVEELEARTRAAEKLAQEVQSRFQQLALSAPTRNGRNSPTLESGGR